MFGAEKGTADKLDGKKLHIGIVQARFNESITNTLASACLAELKALGVQEKNITHVKVPGALEVPVALQAMAESDSFDALIALGCIIRGETYHFELVANTHDTILCFSTRGKVYWLKVYQLPEASRGARGRPIINLLPLDEGERITAILPVKEYDADKYVFFATANGTVKKTSLSDFSRPLSSGIRAINLKEGDELIGVDITDGSNEIMLFSDAGKVVRFAEGSGRADTDATDEVDTDDDAGNDDDGSDNGEGTESKGTFKGVRPMGRTAAGVRGIKLGAGDKVVSLIVPRGDGAILTATENGYGKRTALDEYPTKSRGTQGVISIKVDERNGKVIDAIQVEDTDQIMLITNGGTLVRTRVSEVSVIGRNTGGVRLIRTGEDETVVGLQRVAESDEEETEALAVEGEVSEGTDTAADAGAVDTGEAGDE